jgi:hypothetical protein
MTEGFDIDAVLREWPYQPGVFSARIVQAGDGREVLQMRVELGVLQMELSGRPDGQRPHGQATYFDWLRQQAARRTRPFVLSEGQCFEIDREFLQFYHRRICYLALREFHRAVADADHTLAMMDFVRVHSPDPQWTLSHEQYRPFVLFHRTQAKAMLALEEAGAEEAIEEVNAGLEQVRSAIAALEGEEGDFDSDELVSHLVTLKESLREEYQVGKTLAEQLADAVAAEEYERAAKLRDEIARRKKTTH